MFRPARPTRRLIGLTPLVDVVFILLVFFMLATSYTEWASLAVHVPGATGRTVDPVGSLFVEVRPDGLRHAGRPVALDDLVADLRLRTGTEPELRVLVQTSAGVPLQAVVTVVGGVRAAGVRDVSLTRALEP